MVWASGRRRADSPCRDEFRDILYLMHQGHHHAAAATLPADGERTGGFFTKLFEVFTPRQMCMNYEADVVWLHIIADSMIALAYFSIPLALMYFVRKREDLAFNWMFVLFATFIVACGTTHVFGVLAIWKPYYRVDGVVKLLTGLVSLTTAALLWPLIPRALQLPSPAQLRATNEQLAAEVVVRKRAEEEARRASEELERRVLERTAELHAALDQRADLLERERAAREDAEKANRLKDDFVATLSHELRTPISSILGWTMMLRANPGRADAAYGLEVVERHTRAQMRMIEDLLDISRIASGKLRLDVRSVNLAEVIEAAADMVRPAAEARQVRLETVIDPRSGSVRGDSSRLQQIVWNLLSNAIKFTQRGGSVKLSVRRGDSNVQIVVEDNGQGIRPEFLPHVFERFRQQDASTTRAQGGLGLGLSIAKHLVELHGGTITAHSDGDGQGAVFTVELPATASTSTEAAETREYPPLRKPTPEASVEPVASPRRLDGLGVLVVDDEPDSRGLIKRMLMDAGARVFVAGSGAEAMLLLRQEGDAIGIVLSDIGMPGQDGYSLMREIRSLPNEGASPSRLPAIALTAFARSEDRMRALLAGFQAHLAKPAEPEELVALVASLTGWTGRG